MAYTYRLVKGSPLTHAEYDENFFTVDEQYNAALEARDRAQEWAELAEDTEVVTGSYSAFHWAQKAAASVGSITDEVAQAEAARDAADGFATDAQTYAGQSMAYRDQAESYKNDAQTYAGNASTSADLAEDWAIQPEDVEVTPGNYSALHWAAKADAEAVAALSAKVDAEAARDLAQQWAEEDEDVEVFAGKYSALHYAAKAEENYEFIQESRGIDVHDFGAVGNGTTNDRTAIQNAIDSLGDAGGVVRFHADKKYYIGTSLTVKKNVSLVGTHRFVGSPGDNFDAPYDTMGCVLIVGSANSIYMNSNSSVSGFLVHRYGMTFPTLDASAFAGTAFTINGEDVGLNNCLVLGFNKAVYSTGHQRQRIYDFWMDCNNGIHIESNLDISYISRCHAWPFATIEAVANSISTNGGDDLTRPGVAYKFANTVDWTKVTDCFSYGYYQGFRLDAVNSCTLLNCSADNISSAGVPTYTGSSGFYVNGHENRLIGCQAAAQQAYGIAVESYVGSVNLIVDPVVWVSGDHGILFQQGDVKMTGAVIRDGLGNGITIVDTAARMTINDTYFRNNAGYDWNFVGAHDTSKKLIGKYTTDRTSANIVSGVGSFNAPTITAADPLVIPSQGEVFNISGNTAFGQLAYGYAGRKVTLIFSGTPTVYSATGMVNNMKLASNFVASAGRTLTLIHNGTQWYEVGRL